jgi:DNA mismatch endonuclease (patch repair protein)
MAKKRKKPLSRSQIMARIRGADTKPEMLLRRALIDRGIGYRLHARDLPGRPDVVFRGSKLVVFVHGCFWHRHPGCRHAGDPKTSAVFWQDKFKANTARDRRNVAALHAMGWSVGVLWECEAGRPADLALAVDAIAILRSGRPCGRRSGGEP